MKVPSTAWILLLFAVASGLPFLPTGPNLRWIPMDANIAPPFLASAARDPGDPAGSDLPAFTLPNLVHAARHRILPTLFGIADGDRGALHWNPGQLCGTPFLATQDTFALHPAHLLPWLDPPTFQFALLAWIHSFLACVGCWLLYGSLTGDRGASAILAGLAFGCGPWMTAHHDTLASMTGALAPWMLVFAREILRNGGPGARLGFAATLALSAFAGMIQLVQIASAGLLAALPFWSTEASAAPVERRRRFLGLAFALLAGLLLAAPQLLPLAEIAVDAPRARTAAEVQRRLAVPPSEWLTFGVAELAGTPPALARAGARESRAMPAENDWPTARLFRARTAGGATYMEAVAGVGAAVLVLAWLGLVAGAGRTHLLAVVWIAIGALVATRTPLFDVLQSVPTLAIGNPRRWLFLVALGAALLVGEGVRALARATPGRLGAAALLALPAVVPFTAAFAFPEGTATWLARVTQSPEPLARANVAALVAELWVPTLAVVLSLAALAKRASPAVWVAMLAIDAAALGHRVNPWLAVEAPYPKTRTTDFLVADGRAAGAGLDRGAATGREVPWRLARLEGTDPETWLPPLPPNSPMMFGLRDAQGYEGLLPRRLEELWQAIEPGSVHEHHYLKPIRDPARAALPIFDFIGVKWFLATRADGPPGTVRRFADAEEKTAVFENADWRPFASVASTVRAFDTDADVVRACVESAFAPAREVLINRTDVTFDPDVVVAAPSGAPVLRTLSLGVASGSFALESTTPCVVTLAESFHPGWRAYDQDGRRLPLFPANHAFQGIFADRGVRRIDWRFEPDAWNLGILLAAIGLSALLADGILFRHRKLPPCT